MKPVIFKNHLCATVALQTRHGTEVHCMIGESHEEGDLGSLLGHQVMMVLRSAVGKGGIEEVKVSSLLGPLRIGKESEF